MTSKLSSPEFPPNGRRNAPSQESASQPASPSLSPELPTGRCMFIATAEKRCSCHAFQRNPALPGAYCNCGHQASYHSQYDDTMPPPPSPQPAAFSSSTPPTTTCNCPSHATLLQRLCHLETSHALDRKQWEKELRRERHSRQEDIRALRETMYTFFRFAERDIPRQFADVEDKIENVVDHHQRLQEKVISVEDFSMALDDRVIDLEQQHQHQHQVRTKAGDRARGLMRQGHDEQVRVESNVESRIHEPDRDNNMSIKEETRERNDLSTSNIPGDSRRGFTLPEAKEETSSNSKDSSTSVKRKRTVKIPLPNPPPLFLSE
ncbi:hypothetical protein PISL3812_02735 [Talaromyces islandicus]|uniref:Uncharacterized protein n=1 Tax=Talaromyces islandicus TaxID=28573 RepID=A0A0U1LQQ1_TALIS|nr:hypothetical protein PISL3812_02735 [Talaromyces islandicus]